MRETFTFLFAPVDAVGHFNACIGIAEQLLSRGHRVVFATPMSWKGKLNSLGFTEELYQVSVESSNSEPVGDTWCKLVEKLAPVISSPSIEHIRKILLGAIITFFEEIKYTHARLKEIVTTVQPDVIVSDFGFVRVPSLMDQGIPWILCCSCNPIGISNANVPPACSGYSTEGDRNPWKKFEEEVKDAYTDLFNGYKTWQVENGGIDVELNYPFWTKHSPWANIYMYPMELDYTHLRPNPPNWHRFDAFVRSSAESFVSPETLRNGAGKLIYFSMGTVGCADVDLMKRLIGILAKSPNRFIVSKGPRADEFELAENMWGKSSVPQTEVIQLVDLVITHGGNNTITESFYFGKRVLVLPLLWDQLDNGQRILETGLGLQLPPYKLTEEELLEAIEKLLGDELLERRMRTIGKRIQSTRSQSKVADLVESVAANSKKNTTSV